MYVPKLPDMTENNKKLIIVSNRLPVKLEKHYNEWKLKQSEGGLATGLSSVYKEENTVWIGWPGAVLPENDTTKGIINILEEKRLYPVLLSTDEISYFYDGFSNDTLWPLFHYFPSYAHYSLNYWNAYRRVNQKFADAVLAIAEAGDTVWVHDYQLMLVPDLIRSKMKELNIGFFQHIPFPSYEVFRLIPWRENLLKGLLGADLIGFHTFDDVRHFMSAAMHLAPLQTNGNELLLEDRIIEADCFPMGIDYEKYRASALNEKTKRSQLKIKKIAGDKKIVLSIDRLDYSKGIIQRLEAFHYFLQKHPEWRECVVFLQLIVPSRGSVRQYASLKEEINRLVSDINAQYGTLSWQPIQYLYRSFPLEMISALYTAADILLVTPLRDGMNLVCKEYVASRTDGKGVLILSELAGASKELHDALIINPTNKQAVAEALSEALIMPLEEQERRMHSMQDVVKKFNIHNWVNAFMDKLKEVKQKQQQLSTRTISEYAMNNIIKRKYNDAASRLIFLDYDGTLVPFNNNPSKAAPDNELLELLGQLYADKANHVVIISGRKKDSLEKWIGDLPVDIIAEHGAWSRIKGQRWKVSNGVNNEWKNEFIPLLQHYEMRTPGSFIEEKDYSLAWHYRQVDKGLGNLRAAEIMSNLKYKAAHYGLQVLEGNKVIEIKNTHINKGNAAKEWLDKTDASFILAIGDDQTDEDTFKIMPGSAITIKVGAGSSAATYYLKNPSEVRGFLQSLTDQQEKEMQIMPQHNELIKN